MVFEFHSVLYRSVSKVLIAFVDHSKRPSQISTVSSYNFNFPVPCENVWCTNCAIFCNYYKKSWRILNCLRCTAHILYLVMYYRIFLGNILSVCKGSGTWAEPLLTLAPPRPLTSPEVYVVASPCSHILPELYALTYMAWNMSLLLY